MDNFKKLINWFKSLTKSKQIILVLGLVILLAVANKNKSSTSYDNGEFYNHEFTSGTGSAFGMTGYNQVIFQKDGRVAYCNMNKTSNDKEARFWPSNMTRGTWKFVDKEQKRIEVVFNDGNNADKAGIWEFSDENYKSVKLSDDQNLSRK